MRHPDDKPSEWDKIRAELIKGQLEQRDKRIKELEGVLRDWVEYYDLMPPEESLPVQGWVDAEGEMIAFCTASASLSHSKAALRGEE